MEEVDGINTSTFQQEEELRILIIGGGVAGLTTALAIKRIAAATGLNLRPIIFEADPAETAYTTNMAQHWILWKWAYDLLLELELGGRLSKIASAIHATRSIDADTRETLVAYPPDDEEVGGGAQDPEMGHRPTNNSGAPPMIGLRKMDLTRLLLQALGGIREDLIDGDKFVPSVPDTDSEGAQSDIAQTPTWFADEGYAELIPDLMLGYELDSFMVSANSGNVTARFMNGAVEYGFMIIGADGTHSKVRELLGTRRFSTPIQHAGAAVIHGITRLDNSYDDADHTGSLVSPVRTEDILRLCPDGNAVSLVGRGFAMGINNIGNGMLGWNLVVAQPTPHFHTTQFAAEKQAKAKAEAEAEDLRSGSPGPSSPFPKPRSSSSYFQVEHVTSDGVTEGSLPDPPPGGVSPARSVGSIDTLTDPVSNALGSLTLNGGLASASAPPSPSGSVSSVSSNRPRRSNRIETAFERQLRLQREDILAVKNAAEDAAAFGTSGATTEDPTTHMSGRNAKELAASLAARHASIPTTFLALIDRADPSLTHAMDILDLADEYMKSYTSPNFHPGRIIAIGDAAHPVATNALGSLGGGLAIADACLLAKLIAKHLAPHHQRTAAAAAATSAQNIASIPFLHTPPAHISLDSSSAAPGSAHPLMPGAPNPADIAPAPVPAATLSRQDSTVITMSPQQQLENQLGELARTFDEQRVLVCNTIITEARAEGGWGRVESTWLRSVWRMTWRYGATKNWVRATYQQMLERGGVPRGLISLGKVKIAA